MRFIADCAGLPSGWWIVVARSTLARGSPGTPDPLPARQLRGHAIKKVRKLYVSPNGDRWYLVFDPAAEVFVRHEANIAAGGTVTRVEIAEFVSKRPGAGTAGAVAVDRDAHRRVFGS